MAKEGLWQLQSTRQSLRLENKVQTRIAQWIGEGFAKFAQGKGDE
jgi:hypothetical protein